MSTSRYAIVIMETHGPNLEKRLGYQRVIVRDVPEEKLREVAELLKQWDGQVKRDPRKRRALNGVAKRRGYKRSDFNPKVLAKGRRVEMEHTRNPKVAEQIAMDHLAEDPRYYDKLLKYVENGYRDPGLSPKKRAALSRKIRLLRHEGYPQKQAIAIAHRMLRIPRP
jgi:hypothetical protein